MDYLPELSQGHVSRILNRLKSSKFRGSFSLDKSDIQYINKIGFPRIESHAKDFVRTRLAPKYPENDGKQTPFKGHPVFKAQHATAMCCRKCIEKWHGIRMGVSLEAREEEFIVKLIMAWIEKAFLAEESYDNAQYRQYVKHEAICRRCGACCGLKEGNPCEHLKKDSGNTYFCDIYHDRFGLRKTVKGEPVLCVPIRNMLSKSWWGRGECGYIRQRD